MKSRICSAEVMKINL